MIKEGDADLTNSNDSYILYVGTYPPRECGIATFTRDLTDAIDRRFSPYIQSKILAMNNNGLNIYNYPKKVEYQISDTDMNDYLEIAKKINENDNIKLVCVQHEFGIFGGEQGDNLLAFLELLDKPVVITFHSILPTPNERLRNVVRAIARRVDEIIVMTPKAIEILEKDYKVETRITIIPHGIPSIEFESQNNTKRNLGIENRIVLSSFGMISSGKGYEYVIAALPEVVKKYPNLLYIIVGETHPNVRRIEGEKYRNKLTRQIDKLRLSKHVKFYNKYVTLEEICTYLKATDIYISSGNNPNQITSGTLSYAMGAGRAVISTPFLHALDALKKDNGVLAEFQNKDSFSKQILYLLENESKRREIEKNAYFSTRHMTWSNVANAYMKVFKRYMLLREPEIKNLPKINTSHLISLTDNFGIIQFAEQTTPNLSSGYSLDDNARALLVSIMHYEKFREFNELNLMKTYLDYIKYVQDEDGKLYNFVNRKKRINTKRWSADSQGRALWALGYLISSPHVPNDFKAKAEEIFLKALETTSDLTSPRSIAFTIKGLYFFNRVKNSSYITANIIALANKLEAVYDDNSSSRWNWFEPYLTYANSKLSESLLYAYLATNERRYLEIAVSTLDFLISKTFKGNMFIPIGQDGWYEKDGKRAYYDQQPVDVAYMVQTLILSYKITKDEKYKKKAFNCFQWFLGKNMLNQVVYNEHTGGCHDGIGKNAINLNQGAESTLSYLMARLSIIDV